MKLQFSTSRTPPRGNGFVVYSLKDLFRLVDEFPTKRAYFIAWYYVFEEYDWVWVSPRVMDNLNAIPHFEKQLSKWKGNLAKLAKPLLSRSAKLTQPLSQFSNGTIKVRKFFGKPSTMDFYVGEGVNDRINAKCLKAILNSVVKINQKTELDFLTQFYRSKALKLSISIVVDDGNWSVNYAQSTIEINGKTFVQKSFPEQQLIVLKGLSLAYFSLVLRTNEMRTWFKFFKKEKPIIKQKHYHNDITKLQRSWANGMAYTMMGVDFPIQKSFKRYHTIQEDDTDQEWYDILDFNLPVTVETSTEDTLSTINSLVVSDNAPFGRLDGTDLYDLVGLGDTLLRMGEDVFVAHGSVLVANDVSYRNTKAITIETETEDGEETWLDIDGDKIVSVSRTLWWNTETGKSGIENDHFVLDEEYHGQGVGMAMIGRQIEWCLTNKINTITCYAARDSDEGFVGYKVWHKMGYDAVLDENDLYWSASGDIGEQQFKAFVLKSLEKKILEYPEKLIYQQVNTLLQELTYAQKVKAFSLLPPEFEDRYLSIRFGDENGTKPANDYEDIIPVLSRLQIYEFYTKLNTTLGSNFFGGKREANKNPSQFRLNPTIESIQNLMDLEGFQEFWEHNGGGFKCQIDLSEGRQSEAYLIYALYKEKKGQKLSSGDLLTKAMGTLSSKDLALFSIARTEVRMNQSISKLATKWLL